MKVTTRIAGIAVAAALMVSLGGAASASTSIPTERSGYNESSVVGQAKGLTVKPTAAAWTPCDHNVHVTGVPTACFYKDVQGYVLRQYGYTGAIDGVMGTNSWKAMQRLIKQEGFYSGAIDGIAGPGTKKGLQRLLMREISSYKGPADGILGKQTWKAMALYTYSYMD